MKVDNQFFRSALGGFNRQDVMAYIEKTQKEAAENASRLEKQAAQLQEEWETLRQELASCSQEREEFSKQLTDMTLRYNHAKNNWDAQAAAKESFRSDVAQRDETIRELTGENQKLFHRVQELEEQVSGFRQEKEKIAQLELEARQRSEALLADAGEKARITQTQAEAQAAATVREAEARAAAIASEAQAGAQALRRQTEEEIAAAAKECDALADSFRAVASHMTSELRKLDVTVEQLPINLNHLQDSLRALLERAGKE